jgi:hypothetical protein
MSQSICIDNLKKYEVESEYQAASLKKAAFYFLIPSLSIRLLFLALWLYWKMNRYFKQVSIANLSKCSAANKEACRTCLKQIYGHEQAMIARLDAKLLMLPLIGRLFGRIKATLEDRAETLVLVADDQAVKAVSRLITHFSEQDQPVSDWRRQLETLQ